ncbi:hypothetical protein MCOR25_004943 [Pyricularia grisea]|nr:hypothetical protein MCOR25_004943 [Pyricularia grisea]
METGSPLASAAAPMTPPTISDVEMNAIGGGEPHGFAPVAAGKQVGGQVSDNIVLLVVEPITE